MEMEGFERPNIKPGDIADMKSTSPAGRIGEYLPCLPVDIDWALAVQADELASGNLKHLGEILVEREEITPEELEAALETQRMDRLRRCSFFANLPAADLARISDIAEEAQVAEGEHLLREGQRGDSMYVVASGAVMIYRREGDLGGVELGIARPGDILGEMGYFSDGTRSFSAYALEAAVLLRLRYDLLWDIVNFVPDLAVEFLNLITSRMRESNVCCADSLPV